MSLPRLQPCGARLLPLLLLAACGARAGVTWHAAWPAAAERAGRTGRPLLVQFSTPDRPVSRAMEESTLRDPAVVAAATPFVTVRLDAAAHADRFRSWLGEGGVLAACVVDHDGALLAARRGFVARADYAAWLREAAAAVPRLRLLRRHVVNPGASLELGERLLALGADIPAVEALHRAAAAGDADQTRRAALRLAQHAIADGDNRAARAWLERARLPTSRLEHATVAARIALAEREPDRAVAALAVVPAGARNAEHVLLLARARHEAELDVAAVLPALRRLAARTDSPQREPAYRLLQHIESPDHGHTH